jgi:NitT/TauT family transport system substrate-binding protein
MNLSRNLAREPQNPTFLSVIAAGSSIALRSMVGLLACVGILASAGCDSKPKPNTPAVSDSKQPLTKVALVLNWYPEAEHGGFYAAKVHGIFEKYGLDVEIQPGGKTTVVPQTLTLGRAEFGVINADDVLMARNQQAPIVALMAPIQNGTFEELKNITLQIDSGRPYVPFLKSKGLLDDSVKLAPYFGSVAQIVAGPGFAAQGYSFSEPFMAKEQGIDVHQLMMSDIGYNPYASLLVSTESYVKDHADISQRMVKACVEGWQKYLSDPQQSNAVILAANKQGLTKEALEYGVEALKPLCYENNDMSLIGAMNAERWTQLAQTLVDLKLIDPANLNVPASFSSQYLAPSP